MDLGDSASKPGTVEDLGRTFRIVWAGQLVSIVGSSLTLFGLPIWVFLETESTTQVGFLMLFMALARGVAMPFVGVITDRWDRRHVMILSDAGAAAGTLVVALLLAAGVLEVWHLYPTLAVSAFFGAFQFPAYSAAVTLLVPKGQLGRAAGLAELAESIGRVAGPVLAGVLVMNVGLGGVIIADIGTFLFAVATLLVVQFPRPARSEVGSAGAGTVFQEAVFGFRYLRERRGLFLLVVIIGVIAGLMAFINLLIFPLILTIGTETEFGTTVSLAALGLVAGSMVMSAWGGSKRKMDGFLGFLVVVGAGLVVMGLRPSLVLIGAGLGLTLFAVPIVNGSSQAIFQTKVEPDVQGRVFAIRRLVGEAATPLAFLFAGPLADAVDSGSGRGVALLFVVLGALTIGVAAAGYACRPLRELEDQIPDAVGRPAPQEPPVGLTE